MQRICLVLVGCSIACADPQGRDPEGDGSGVWGDGSSEGVFAEDGSSDGTTSSGGTGDESSASSSSDADDDDSGIKLDVGSMESGSTGACIDGRCGGCTAVDLLFVIDNSLSMENYQVALGQAFPSFADAIVEALPPGTSLHVGVTSTEMGYTGFGLTSGCSANAAPDYYDTPDDSNSGANGAQGRLYQPPGQPAFYELTTDQGPAAVEGLKAWFADAAAIGEDGSNIEMSAAAAAWATDPANDDVNAGFIRDEGAVLVLFFVQDEPDQTPPAEASDLVDRITAAKAGCGGMECVVGGGFVDEACLPSVALGTIFDAMGAPAVTSTLPPDDEVVPEDFVPVLRDTLSQVISDKCEEITPVG